MGVVLERSLGFIVVVRPNDVSLKWPWNSPRLSADFRANFRGELLASCQKYAVYSRITWTGFGWSEAFE